MFWRDRFPYHSTDHQCALLSLSSHADSSCSSSSRTLSAIALSTKSHTSFTTCGAVPLFHCASAAVASRHIPKAACNDTNRPAARNWAGVVTSRSRASMRRRRSASSGGTASTKACHRDRMRSDLGQNVELSRAMVRALHYFVRVTHRYLHNSTVSATFVGTERDIAPRPSQFSRVGRGGSGIRSGATVGPGAGGGPHRDPFELVGNRQAREGAFADGRHGAKAPNCSDEWAKASRKPEQTATAPG